MENGNGQNQSNAGQLLSKGADTCMSPQPATRNLSFSQALEYLKRGMKVKRASWGGHWFMASDVNCQQTMPDHYVRAFGLKKLIVAVLKDCGGCEPAQPYQSDILAEDWEIVL